MGACKLPCRRQEQKTSAEPMKRLIYLIILLTLAICLTSCRSVQYVPVESVRTEIEYRDRWQRDSIHVQDSIVIQSKGDTVFRDRWHTLYKDRLLRDTTYIYRTDSIQVPYPVERNLTWWQNVKQETGGIVIGAIIVLLFVIVWLVYKKRKR